MANTRELETELSVAKQWLLMIITKLHMQPEPLSPQWIDEVIALEKNGLGVDYAAANGMTAAEFDALNLERFPYFERVGQYLKTEMALIAEQSEAN